MCHLWFVFGPSFDRPTSDVSELEVGDQFATSTTPFLLSPPMSTTLATFCEVPVSVVFDGNASSSSVCLEWVLNSGIGPRNSRISGLLSLPGDAGVMSMDLNNIPVASSLHSDLVLGLDWYRFVCGSTSENVVHLSSGALELRHHPRHHPLPTTGTEPSLSIGAS